MCLRYLDQNLRCHPQDTAAQTSRSTLSSRRAGVVDTDHKGGSCLLRIPSELRDNIYSWILDDILTCRNEAWSGNPSTQYDGLQTACKQLRHETLESLFVFNLPLSRFEHLSQLRATPLTARNIRSLTVEVPSDIDMPLVRSASQALYRLQLSLQELRLFFVETNLGSTSTRFHGCGNLPSRTSEAFTICLSNRQSSKRLSILAALLVLCQLRVLVVENANTPLLRSMILANKSHLTALTVRSDPRSIVHNYSYLSRPELRRLLSHSRAVAPVRTLELSANAVLPALDIVSDVKEGLEHFSWRVPSEDFQRAVSQDFKLTLSFYQQTENLLRYLATWSPKLDTLRLCIDIPDRSRSNRRWQLAIGDVVGGLNASLPRMLALKHFELHFTKTDQFYPADLVDALPDTLRRFYVADQTISAQELRSEIQRRYLSDIYSDSQIDTHTSDQCLQRASEECTAREDRSWLRRMLECEKDTSVEIAFKRYRRLYNSSHDDTDVCTRSFVKHKYDLENQHLSGDRVLSHGGVSTGSAWCSIHCLRFITYEYEDHGDELEEVAYQCPDYESVRTIILKLNGRLLDREHNSRHRVRRRIEPSSTEEAVSANTEIESNESRPETETYSVYRNIYLAIYNASERTREEGRQAKQWTQDVQACLADKHGSWDQYFGGEIEAEEVSRREAVMKAENMLHKSVPMIVDVPSTHRCKWMAPEYIIPPVSAWPEPVLPRDWKEDI